MHVLKVKELKGTKKIYGLLGINEAYPVLFKTRFGIHTFGLQFPIDVLVLDKNNLVVKLSANLKPNSIFIWNPKFDKVVELPAGEIDKSNIKIKSQIEFQVV